jgi:hypothetical protein
VRFWVSTLALYTTQHTNHRKVSLGKSSSAALERLVQQTEALVQVLAEDGGAGAFVNVGRDFLQ